VLAFIPSPAFAANYDIRTSAVGTDGYATASGTITFIDRNSVRITSTVADRCGSGTGDGEGAYLWAQITYSTGAFDDRVSLNWDNDGCDNGNRGLHTVTLNPGVDIVKVRVKLDEADGSCCPSETVYSTWKDNPHT
jgi:hypothetical protein